MKFPSLKSLVEGAKNTFLRFPVELLFATAGTIAAIANIELNNINPAAEEWCIRVIMTANLGLLLSLAVTLFTESRGIIGGKKWAFKIGALVLSLLWLILLNPLKNQADLKRFFLLSLAFHLIVAYAAFTKRGHIQGFWQFNKTLFLRFLTSVLYSAVLYAGIAAALGAMNLLFNFKFEFDTFFILWVCIVGLFNTMFFLAGMPADHARLNNDNSYPKGLKVFTQYVLIPLATIYVIILLVYEAKILVQWSLPKGYVSNLILGYAVFGILSLLLVYPVREQDENKWLKTYTRSFYFLMLPLLILLFVAVGARVFKYGVTEQRYFLIVLAVWLLCISGYFLLFKKQNIKLIPISLSIVALISVYGPQSAFSVSQYSQTRILISIFKRNNGFKQDKLVKVAKIDSMDEVDAASKLRYLINDHGLISLQPYINKNLKAVSDSIENQIGYNSFKINTYETASQKIGWAYNYLGLTRYYNNTYGQAARGIDTKHAYSFSVSAVISTRGYDYMITANTVDTNAIRFDGIEFKRKVVNYKDLVLTIDKEKFTLNDEKLANDLMKIKDLDKYTSGTLQHNYTLPPDSLTLTDQSKNYKITLIIDSFSFGQLKNGTIEPAYVGGTYLIKKLH